MTEKKAIKITHSLALAKRFTFTVEKLRMKLNAAEVLRRKALQLQAQQAMAASSSGATTSRSAAEVDFLSGKAYH